MAGERGRVKRGLHTPQIEALRIARLWNQTRLAHEAGVSPVTVMRAERGEVVAFETVGKLAAALDVTPEQLCREAPAQTAAV